MSMSYMERENTYIEIWSKKSNHEFVFWINQTWILFAKHCLSPKGHVKVVESVWIAFPNGTNSKSIMSHNIL